MSRQLLIALCIIAVLLSQCKTKSNRPFSDNALPSQFFTIDINKDTVIHTDEGALINIPAGTLKTDGATSVELEVKEAYTIADMLLGGLTTKTGKNLLSSGGMIFVSPADNSKITIVKPLGISIPTKYQEDGMQLYKGERRSDSAIDWTDPQPLPKQSLSERLNTGKLLFTSNCASCHTPTKPATGPELAFLDQRRDWEWLKHHIRNSGEMIANGDKLSRCIFERYNKTAMTAFPKLTDTEIHLIFDYVNYQAGNIDPASIPDFKKSFDSCQLYLEKVNELTSKREKERELKARQRANENKNALAATPSGSPSPKYVQRNDSVYYKFTIQQFGWYNIDILFKNLPGFENSELMVRIIGEYRKEITVYLVLPSRKILLDGGLAEGKNDEYAFFTTDGKIPLPQNMKAYVLAVGHYQDQVYFGKTEFNTSLSQFPEVQLSVTTLDQLNIEIKKLEIHDLSVIPTESLPVAGNSVADTSYADLELNKLERFRPKDCDCNCGLRRLEDSTSAEALEIAPKYD